MHTNTPRGILSELWQRAGGDAAALFAVTLTGDVANASIRPIAELGKAVVTARKSAQLRSPSTRRGA